MSEQKISFSKATLMGINVMVGAGILAGPGPMAKVAGNASFLGWGLAGLIAFPMVYCAARLAGMIPGSGGLYIYCKTGFGETVGFYSGWLYFLCYLLATAGLLSAFRDFLQVTYPGSSLFSNPTLFFVTVLSAVFVLNMFRVIVISTIQSYLTLIKATPAIIAIILLPFFVKTDFSIPMSDVFQLPLALTFSLFGYMGFEFCCNLSHLVEGGAQAAKRAVLGGFFAVVLLYTIFHFSLLQIMGAENLATYLAGGYPQFVMHKFMLLGKALVFVVSATTVLTYFNSTNGLVFLCVTLVHALSSDKKLRFFNFWNKLSCNARPLNILAVVSLLVIGIGSLVTNTKFLMSSCLFGLSSLMIVVMLSLLKVDKKPTLFSRFVAVGGIVMSAVLLGYHWLQAGDTQIDRLIALSPLAIGLIVGALLRLNSNDDDTSVHREAVSLERQVIVKEAEMSEFAKKPKGTDTDNG